MQASPAEHRAYLWQPTGKRLAVDLRLYVVDRLAAETLAGFEAPGRGTEVGGLLLGRTRREQGITIVGVEEIEPIECEHAAGPSLMLSAPDRHALEARLRRRKSSVVGFYRSNTRREFAVTLEDVALLSSYFADPSNVFLLIHAVRDEPLRAGFVLWEGRAVSGKTPSFEFPLDRDALAGQSRMIEPPVPVPVTTRPAASPPWLRTGWVAAGLAIVGVTAGVLYNTPAREPAPSTPAASAPATVAPVSLPTVETPAPIATVQPPADREAVGADAMPVSTAASSDTAHRTVPEPLRAFTPVTPAFPAPDPPVLTDPPSVGALPSSEAPPSLLTGMVTPPPKPAEPPPVVRPAPSPLVDVAVDSAAVPSGKFRPPWPVRQPRPQVPGNVQRGITRDAIVNVRVYVDRAGKVEFAELLSDGTGANRDLAALAVFASRRWEFEPATVNGKAVPGKAVLRFRFAPDVQ